MGLGMVNIVCRTTGGFSTLSVGVTKRVFDGVLNLKLISGEGAGESKERDRGNERAGERGDGGASDRAVHRLSSSS